MGPNLLKEKDLSLDIAKRVKKLLLSQPGFTVVLTRTDDADVPLNDRVALANRSDVNHVPAKAAMETLKGERLITTWPVITETCHLILARLGIEAELAFVDSLVAGPLDMFSIEG